eukprot:TRINITY_DN52191_c0_g1_i1.p1 TRINITY_DN52191_c0_g1~~TRINITY_DN52191_c0_g1_i1.p1  ORF type:complete len:228 (-),score=53.45 TRINITY_DN52191_c0_g1_i1:114-797(-)
MQQKNEAELLQACERIRGVPKVRWLGESHGCRVLAIDVLGADLKCADLGGLRAVFRLGEQMWRILEQVHTLGVVHRDVKPDNWCLGPEGSEDAVFLIDFGLACNSNKAAAGTPEYKSVFTHRDLKLSALDDVYGAFYTLISLILPEGLPWKDKLTPKMSKNEKDALMLEEKERAHAAWLETQCLGCAVSKVLEYVTSLVPEDSIDYKLLRDLTREAETEASQAEFQP